MVQHTKIILPVIFIIGFILRIWELNQVFLEPDSAIWAIVPIKLYTHSLFVPTELELNPLAQLAAWPYGYFYPVLLSVWIGILSILNITINEFALVFPCALIGSGSIVIIYLLTKELFSDKESALLAALLIAVLPLHVGLSRTMITTRIPGAFLLLTILLLFIKQLKSENKQYRWLTSIPLAIYSVCTPMFVTIFPLLALTSFIYSKGEKGLFHKFKRLFFPLLSKEMLLLPLLALSVPMAVLFYGMKVGKLGGQLGYILRKDKEPGFYLFDVCNHFIHNTGILLSLIIVAALVYGLTGIIRNRRAETLLMGWAAIFLFPFIFLISDKITSTREYLLDGTTPLIILSSFMLVRFVHLVRDKYGKLLVHTVKVALIVLVIGTFVSTLHSVFRLNNTSTEWAPSPVSKDLVFGSLRKDNGVKTAGYYVRENVPEDVKMFVDMNPYVGPLYFGRIVYSPSDANTERTLNYLNKVKDRIDMAIVNTMHEKDVVKLLGNEFFKTVEILNNDEQVMVIYSRNKETLRVLDISRENKLFDKKYGTAKKLIPESLNYPELTPVMIE